MSVTDDTDKRFYALSGNTAGIKPGDRMTLQGKKIKPKDAGKTLVSEAREINQGPWRLSALNVNLGSPFSVYRFRAGTLDSITRKAFAKNQTWQVPTFTVQRSFAFALKVPLRAVGNSSLCPSPRRRRWKSVWQPWSKGTLYH